MIQLPSQQFQLDNIAPPTNNLYNHANKYLLGNLILISADTLISIIVASGLVLEHLSIGISNRG